QMVLDDRAVQLFAFSQLFITFGQLGSSLFYTALQFATVAAQFLLRLMPLGNVLTDSFVGDDATIGVAKRRVTKFQQAIRAVGMEYPSRKWWRRDPGKTHAIHSFEF